MTQPDLERINPKQENLNEFFEAYPDHKQRYEFAIDNISAGMRIADIACGVGYGTWLISKKVKSVVGVDISDEALNHARHNFMEDNIQYIHGDSYMYDTEFDAVISFETIEHMDEGAGDTFLQKIKRSLKPDGILIISTPINKTDSKVNVTEFHVREYDDYEFPLKLRNNGFEIISMYGQGSPFHRKLYGKDGSAGFFRYIQLGFHRILPKQARNALKLILMGNPNDGLTICKEDWRSTMIQIAVCKVGA